MYKTVLFDFDGTLIDTHNLIIQGLNRISMKSRGIPFSEEDHASILGKTLDIQMQMLSPDNWEYHVSDFQNWYRLNHDFYANPYENIEDMLQMLRADGYQLGIVTNNSWEGLQMGLDFLEIHEYFDCIITREDVQESKPSPEGILKALSLLSTPPESCMFIGDSAGDILAARAAGVLPVGQL